MLEKELAALKEKGKKPFILRKLFYFFLRPRSTEAHTDSLRLYTILIVATVGSTSTGAIDNIAEITAVSKFLILCGLMSSSGS
jgi:hypothetical protein